jgi:Bacterial Ig domain
MLDGLRIWRCVFAVAAAGGISLAHAQPMMPWPGPPFVSVQSSDPLASEPGDNPGSFTISRTGDTNAALTIDFSFGGTAKNGTDYIAVPTNITLVAGQYSTNITITPVSEPAATGYKTVKLTLPREHFEWDESVPPFVVGSLNHALLYIVYNYTNVPPSVSLVTPTNGASFLSKPNIFLAATASDSNGWVTAVQFLANGSSVGTVSNYPFGRFPLQPLVMRESHGSVVPVLPGARLNRFQFVWTDVPPGAYSLQAVATDNAGLQTISEAVDITVTTNLPMPQVRIINPAKGAKFPDQAPIHLYAAAGETNGVVDTVEFFANGNSIGTASNYLAAEPLCQAPFRLQWLPYNLAWTNAPVGSNILTAVATDNNGSKATSAPVNIIVTTNLYRHYHPWW